ncbi:MAG: hypothetical protein U1E37_01980 [Sphingomonadaceae bacterium]|jgi:hypothetical protein
MGSQVRTFAFAAALLLLATSVEAGKPKKAPPPPPPPPPPPAYVYVAWKPIPPEWAAPTLTYPELGPDGVRLSVNRNISSAQALWNLRSGYNVAALNCRDPKHGEILVNYRLFLKTHAKVLRAANAKVDAEFRAKHGAGYVKYREKFMTEVYNHFAIPPVQPAFCNAALAMSKDAKAVKSANLTAFATTALPSLEIVFDDFFKRYDQYRLEMAAWEARWGKDAVPGSRVLATVQNTSK